MLPHLERDALDSSMVECDEGPIKKLPPPPPPAASQEPSRHTPCLALLALLERHSRSPP